MTQLSMVRDVNGFNTFGLTPSTNMQSTILAENVAQSFTAPNKATNYLAIFSVDPGLRVWVSYDGNVAEVPGATVAATNSELNPTARLVASGATISCITPDTVAQVGISFYAI